VAQHADPLWLKFFASLGHLVCHSQIIEGGAGRAHFMRFSQGPVSSSTGGNDFFDTVIPQGPGKVVVDGASHEDTPVMV
jgi:hypothetical protein